MSDQNHYWASSPFPHPVDYPKWVYHATEPAKQVSSPDQLAALGPEWSANYADKKRDYPKTKFKVRAEPKEGELHYETTVVENPEAEGKIGSGWSDTLPPAPKEPNAHAPVSAGDSKKK